MEYLGVSRQAVYDSRARNKFPGNRGHRRSKRLLFPAEEIEKGRVLVEAGEDPDLPEEITADVEVAILWALGGIERKLGRIAHSLDVIAGWTPTVKVDVHNPPRHDDGGGGHVPQPTPEPSEPEMINE